MKTHLKLTLAFSNPIKTAMFPILNTLFVQNHEDRNHTNCYFTGSINYIEVNESIEQIENMIANLQNEQKDTI